jgi:hypothetical protein
MAPIRLGSSLLLLCLVSLSRPAPAAAPPPFDPQILAPLRVLVAGITSGDLAKVASAYTADPTIADEFAPFLWRGPGAPAKWLAGFEADGKSLQITDPRVTQAPPRFVHVDKNLAYAAVPMTFSFKADGNPQTEHGGFALTLAKAGSHWRISSSAWYKIDDSTEVPL